MAAWHLRLLAPTPRSEIARQSYLAFARADRRFFKDHLSDDFTFSRPQLDRVGWFERCWAGAGHGQEFTFVRLVGAGVWHRHRVNSARDRG